MAAAAASSVVDSSAACTVPWPCVRSAYRLLDVIGEGAFAKVYRAECEARGESVAIKIIHLDRLHTSISDIQNEVRTMALCRHDNVLALLACFVCDTELWLVMPLMDKGSCHHIIRTRRRLGLADDANPGLPEAAVRAILAQLLEALAYLHAQKQIHRDVKAGNILLSTGGAVKIADFGVAGWLHENITREDGRRDTFVGTPCWMAPEVMEQTNGYNERADIWSVGITALELATGSAPYADLPPMHVLLKTLNEPPPTLATYTTLGKPAPRLSADFSRFVARCLVKDPARRPSAAELLREKYMAKADMAPLTAMLAPLPTVSAPTSPPTPMPSSAPAAGSAAATAGLGVRAGAASDLGAGLGGPDDGSDWVFWDIAHGASMAAIVRPTTGPTATEQPISLEALEAGLGGEIGRLDDDDGEANDDDDN